MLGHQNEEGCSIKYSKIMDNVYSIACLSIIDAV